ncbi:ferredoxin [Candidatus Falkowbacteria bacterium]|nr:ferredoxin [Candidatus Falkowbacteria bacterium]
MGTIKFTISHKRKDCIGCGHCALVAPHTWTMNHEDGLSDLKNACAKGDDYMVADADIDVRKDNELAESSCPVNIIRLGK